MNDRMPDTLQGENSFKFTAVDHRQESDPAGRKSREASTLPNRENNPFIAVDNREQNNRSKRTSRGKSFLRGSYYDIFTGTTKDTPKNDKQNIAAATKLVLDDLSSTVKQKETTANDGTGKINGKVKLLDDIGAAREITKGHQDYNLPMCFAATKLVLDDLNCSRKQKETPTNENAKTSRDKVKLLDDIGAAHKITITKIEHKVLKQLQISM